MTFGSPPRSYEQPDNRPEQNQDSPKHELITDIVEQLEADFAPDEQERLFNIFSGHFENARNIFCPEDRMYKIESVQLDVSTQNTSSLEVGIAGGRNVSYQLTGVIGDSPPTAHKETTLADGTKLHERMSINDLAVMLHTIDCHHAIYNLKDPNEII